MKRYVFLILAATMLFACNKVKISSPDFNVATAAATYKAGDTITFNVSGNPDNLVFFTGEPGYRYENRNRVSSTGGVTQLQFATTVTQGNQTGNLALLVSTNYNGSLDSGSIRAATWTDITSRAAFATSAANTPSGIVNLSDFESAGVPFYIGFKYRTNTATGTKARQWNINSFQVNNYFPDSSIGNVAVDISSAGFGAVSIKGDSLKWSIAATALQFPAGIANNLDEDWAISKPIDFTKVEPDGGIAIKNSSYQLHNFTYIYAKPGNYTVTFVASNVSSSNQYSAVKQFSLTITP
ncbi:DUF5017 domain-containing protein [Parasediminibacterium sp. JCM 36343]|uniref:DUF5017 domain-containing protein n=1 Tax=Parasediminibacterium sp. JCM 36343 TaxID=3374279 RepID=UPI0039793B22